MDELQETPAAIVGVLHEFDANPFTLATALVAAREEIARLTRERNSAQANGLRRLREAEAALDAVRSELAFKLGEERERAEHAEAQLAYHGHWPCGHVCEGTGDDPDECRICAAEAREAGLREALTPFASGGEWGLIKAWLVNGPPTRGEGIRAARSITELQVVVDAALAAPGASPATLIGDDEPPLVAQGTLHATAVPGEFPPLAGSGTKTPLDILREYNAERSTHPAPLDVPIPASVATLEGAVRRLTRRVAELEDEDEAERRVVEAAKALLAHHGTGTTYVCGVCRWALVDALAQAEADRGEAPRGEEG